MRVIGVLMALIGAGFLLLGAFIGSAGVANIPGTIFGMALFIAGAIFIAADYIVDNLQQKPELPARAAPEAQTEDSGPWRKEK